MKILFVDLDGTINSSSKVRDHLVPTCFTKNEHWAEWHKAHVKEKPNVAVINLVRALYRDGWRVVYLTSRNDCCTDSTVGQIDAWDITAHSDLVLRPAYDNRPPKLFKASYVKHAMFWANAASGENPQVMVIDDDPDVCAELRKIPGVDVIQVAKFTGG